MSMSEKEEEAEIVPLRLLPGGKTPPPRDWLSPIEIGREFLAKRNDSSAILMHFMKVDKTERAVLLRTMINSVEYIWVLPDKFCDQYKFIEELNT